MTETTKDYVRIDMEEWKDKSIGCPGRDKNYCHLIRSVCVYEKCPMQYWKG
jgi:hypothetical protein